MDKLKKLFRKSKEQKLDTENINNDNENEEEDNENIGLEETRAEGEDVREWIEKYTEISESYDYESTGRNTARLNESAHFSEVFTPRTDEDEDLIVSDLNEEVENTFLLETSDEKLKLPSGNTSSNGVTEESIMLSPRKHERAADTDLDDSLDFEERLTEKHKGNSKTETAADQRDALSPEASLNNSKMATRGDSADNTGSKTIRLSPLQSDYDIERIGRKPGVNNGHSGRDSETFELYKTRRDSTKSGRESEKFHDQEKSDLVQGFILEKGLLIEEHEKEKQRMLLDFMKEKRNLLRKTKAENNEIEARQQTTQQDQTQSNGGKYKTPVLIQVDHKVITPEEFLSGLELEKKHEHEKENLERSFREERINLKERLESDFDHKLLKEKRSMDSTIEDMKREIDRLNYQKDHLEERIRYQGDKLELEFDKERAETEREFCHAHDALKREMEFKFDQELIILNEEHDQIVKELQDKIKVSSTEFKKQTYDFKLEVQKEDMKEIDDLEAKNQVLKRELRKVTKENDKLNNKIIILKREGPVEEDNRINLKDFMEKEYEERIIKLVEENEELSECINELVRNKDHLLKKVQSCEVDDDRTSIRLKTCEKLLVEMEESATVLRKENEDLSLEINCLRDEKQELMTQINGIRTENSNLKMNINRAQNKGNSDDERCISLEKEILHRDTVISKLNQNMDELTKKLKDGERKYSASHEELLAVRRLLETEKSESKRLNERYRKDASSLRKKDNDLNTATTKYEDMKTQVSFSENKHKLMTEKITKLETENNVLNNQLSACEAKSKAKYDESNNMNNRFAQELTSRVEFIKSIYEKENHGLKNQIQLLRNRTAELEETINTNNKNSGLFDIDHSSRANAVIERLLGKETTGKSYSTTSFSPKMSIDKRVFNGALTRLDENGNLVANQEIAENHYRLTSGSDSPTDSLTEATSKMLQTNHCLNSIDNGYGIQSPNKENQDFYIRAEITCDDDQDVFLFDKILETVDQAEKGLEGDVLRALLKDVKSEVNGLNEMLNDNQEHSHGNIIHQSKNIHSVHSPQMELPQPPLHRKKDLDRLKKETELTENYFQQIENQALSQLGNMKVERTDSKETIRRLYMENLGLHEKLYNKEKYSNGNDMSYQELLHKRLHLEKLVSRLQTKLNENDNDNNSNDQCKPVKRKIVKIKKQRQHSRSRHSSTDDIV